MTLILAGLLEIAWSSALKKAEGNRRPGWAITGIALTGIIVFDDPATLGRFISIAAIVAGIVGLKLLGG